MERFRGKSVLVTGGTRGIGCIAPADIETDMTAGWPEELRARLKGMTPLGRR